MAIFLKAKRFVALPAADKWLIIKAVFLLGFYRCALAIGSFGRLTAGMRHSAMQFEATGLTAQQKRAATRVGALVAMAAVATPWRSRCLVQVLVVQHLLEKQQIPGQILIGVSTSAGGAGQEEAFGAHAWLQCGDSIVSGESGSDQYQVISSYAW